jgi:carbamoyl-phosphate synthase/aspartate carbamoyltransferase
MKCQLVLKTGQVFTGNLFGYTDLKTFNINGENYQEIVFQTGMVGYVESLTDPSYCDQFLVYTYPIIGNYGVPKDELDEFGFSKVFESDRVHPKALIVQECIDDNSYSHWQAEKGLSEWLNENKVVGVSGIDTRELTKIIREHGTMNAKIVPFDRDLLCVEEQMLDKQYFDKVPQGLVAKVSRQDEKVYFNDKTDAAGNNLIYIVDCGIKNSQIRILLEKVQEYNNTPDSTIHIVVHIVPYDHVFTDKSNIGVFVSNGPGDPRDDCLEVIHNELEDKLLNSYAAKTNNTIFGICLGHQIVAQALGYEIEKMKYGNRGHNIPVVLENEFGRINNGFITTQNHGYSVIVNRQSESLKNKSVFTNINDSSNEGLLYNNIMTTQFHPEARAGPNDTIFMFDLFLRKFTDTEHKLPGFRDLYVDYLKKNANLHLPYTITPNICKKILLLGSGGLSIGQAGEFDYSGTQAIKSFKEEGIKVILVNPNIATIQTSKGLADKVYYDPVTPEYITQIINIERPDGIALSFGGQTALNCGIQLYESGHIGGSTGVHILGTPVEAIQMTEDRDAFRNMLAEISEECAPSDIAYNLDDAKTIANNLGYPVLVRAAFALGGLGSGFASCDEGLTKLVEKALSHSTQIIIDKSLKGWKEVEYEIVRDCYDNCIAVCNMENLDPLGVHTGESIVVAPSQTLTDNEYFSLRDTAFRVIRKLGIIGECNIQYALDPTSNKYYIIEVNARLSRSSALASKATGYPLAHLAGKLALGYSLLELENKVTTTSSFFEPSLDYCVVKIPRWDLNKFPLVDRKIGSSMKSVGEVMAISRSFEEAFQKALRMANEQLYGFDWHLIDEFNDNVSESTYIEELKNPTPDRIQTIAYVLDDYMTVDEVHKHSKIDKWFLNKMLNIKRFATKTLSDKHDLSPESILRAKQLGFSDKYISHLVETTEASVRELRKKHNIFPIVKQIDTVAGEFPCYTNYLYLTYNGTHSDIDFDEHGVIVLGSGVYRIGSSVEFDWCAVNCIRQLRSSGYKTVMINYNPETVSTDYDEADRLYFDELTFESVFDIYNLENSSGIILSMGGQVANNIAVQLDKSDVNILGTNAFKIDEAENRFKFSRMLDNLKIQQPQWKELQDRKSAFEFCDKVGYPCLVRPSYVLSGAAMNVAYSEEDLGNYLDQASAINKEHPVVISKFIMGAKEIEVDAVAYKGVVKLMAIAEHVENAGIHSGDATLVLPAQDLTPQTMRIIKNTVARIGKELEITGPFNIQFMAKYDNVYVIECNLRASRSMPFASKVFDVNFIRVATCYIMQLQNEKITSTSEREYEEIYENGEGLQISKCFGRYWEPKWVGVKVPQFSFSRLDDADTKLGVEMRSTGEVACFGENKYEAYLKALRASNFLVNKSGSIIISIGSDEFRDEFSKYLKYLENIRNVYFTPSTGAYYGKNDTYILSYEKVINMMKKGNVGLFINISNKTSFSYRKTNGWMLRRTAINSNTPLITNIKCAKLYINAICNYLEGYKSVKGVDSVVSLNRYKGKSVEEYYNNLLGDTLNNKLNNTNDENSDLETIDLPDKGLNSNDIDVINSKLKLPRLLFDVCELNCQDLRYLYALALKMKDNRELYQSQPLLGKCVGLLFDEPSSRTYLSFASAISKLGGKCIDLRLQTSSMVKGESMEDTFITFQTYVDALVVRVSDSSFFETIQRKKLNTIPIINAGCGNTSHPTQALLDVLTIREERGTVNGSEISIVGDLKNSRTVKSLLNILKNYRVKVNLVPYNDYLYLHQDILDDIQRSGVIVERHNNIRDVISQSDVIYMTRLQQERGSNGDVFVLNTELLAQAKTDLVVMHPLPRNQEISRDVDSDPRAAYFRQMKYGLWVRMALLYNLLCDF